MSTSTSVIDELFDNSPFNKLDEDEPEDPPPSISVEEAVSFQFPSESDPKPSSNGVSDEEAVEGDDTPTTPHDDIKVSVKSYQTTEDDFKFSVEVEVNGQTRTVQRAYKDLAWLHRNLSRRMELGGYILPPLPAPPPSTKSVDPKMTILGDKSRAMFGDCTRLPCIEVEHFMQALADHKFFSENDTVHTYVAKDQVSQRDSVSSSGLWGTFTGMVSDFQLSKVEEVDEDFRKFLLYVTDLAPLLKECAQNHSKLVSSESGLACSQLFIGEMLKEHSTFETFRNKTCSSACQRLGDGLDEVKQGLHSQLLDSRHTVGVAFDLYHGYCIQAKEMLYRRLSKLQRLLVCTSKLDKAKPEKKQEAEDARETADRELRDITETARNEIDSFKQQYVQCFSDNLIGYAQSRLTHSQQTHEKLTVIRDQLLEI